MSQCLLALPTLTAALVSSPFPICWVSFEFDSLLPPASNLSEVSKLIEISIFNPHTIFLLWRRRYLFDPPKNCPGFPRLSFRDEPYQLRQRSALFFELSACDRNVVPFLSDSDSSLRLLWSERGVFMEWRNRSSASSLDTLEPFFISPYRSTLTSLNGDICKAFEPLYLVFDGRHFLSGPVLLKVLCLDLLCVLPHPSAQDGSGQMKNSSFCPYLSF